MTARKRLKPITRTIYASTDAAEVAIEITVQSRTLTPSETRVVASSIASGTMEACSRAPYLGVNLADLRVK